MVRSDIGSWFDDPAIFELVEREFARGGYAGIGEFHLYGRRPIPPGSGEVWFSVRHSLYLRAHADDEALEILFRHNPKARIIWAHTGFRPRRKGRGLSGSLPGAVGELSYRHGITGAGGELSPAWRRLFERYPDRFLIGSDTWINERWSSYPAIMAGYRAWLSQLPREVAEKIAFRNAERLFGQQ